MKRWSFVFLMLFVSLSCEKIRSYPDVPYVEYAAYKVSLEADALQDDLVNFNVTFKFRLEDGDGNVGLGQGDTTGVFAPGKPYYYNLFVTLLRKVDGEFVRDENVAAWNWRLSDQMIRTGSNKTLIADVEKSNVLYANDFLGVDTVCFEFYVVDRALNSSDTIRTAPIPFREATDDYVSGLE